MGIVVGDHVRIPGSSALYEVRNRWILPAKTLTWVVLGVVQVEE
jgi:hypothetical protein